jgi:signal transduction histidine kinase
MVVSDPPGRPKQISVVETRLRALLDAMDHAVVLLDWQCNLANANRAFVSLTGVGIPVAKMIGIPLAAGPATFRHLYADPDASYERIRSMIGQGRTVADDRHTLADGRIIAHDYQPITADGTTVGHLWIMRALGGRHASAGRRDLAPDAVGPSPIRGELVATIAHELRTPATSVTTFAAMLDDDGLDQDVQRRAARAVRRNAERLLSLAEDLLLYSDLETDAEPHGDREVDLAPLVRAACSPVEPPVQTSIGAGPAVTGDPRHLRRAVEAVVGVVVALVDGPGVTVRADADTTGWTLTVHGRTDGPVTTERLLSARVPERDDPDTTRTAALTLLLAQAIARHSGGRLDIDDGHDEFALTLRLPTPRV